MQHSDKVKLDSNCDMPLQVSVIPVMTHILQSTCGTAVHSPGCCVFPCCRWPRTLTQSGRSISQVTRYWAVWTQRAESLSSWGPGHLLRHLSGWMRGYVWYASFVGLQSDNALVMCNDHKVHQATNTLPPVSSGTSVGASLKIGDKVRLTLCRLVCFPGNQKQSH